MQNHRSIQSALMNRFGTDLRHQYGIFGGESQTSFSRNATRAGSEEGLMFSQARPDAVPASRTVDIAREVRDMGSGQSNAEDISRVFAEQRPGKKHKCQFCGLNGDHEKGKERLPYI